MRLVQIELDRGEVMDLTTVGGLRIGCHIISEGEGGLHQIKKCINSLWSNFYKLIVSIVCQTISCITHTKPLMYIHTIVVVSHNMFYTISFTV